MSQPCIISNCKEPSRVLCYCCNKNLCLEHFSTHNTSQTDQINILQEQFKRFDTEKLIDDGRQKLDKWRYDSLKKIERFYENKYEEFNRYYLQKFHEQQKQIEQLCKKDNINELKQKIDEIQQKGITINIRPLSIDDNLIIIGELNKHEFDITTLSLPYQTFEYSEKLGFALASNNRFLLIDKNPLLTLFDSSLTITQQSLWEYGLIYDICWSAKLDSFILITEKSKAFLVNGNNLSITFIEPLNNQLWILCTCSNSSLYLVSSTNGIVQFNLSPSISYDKRWDTPISCKNNQFIKDINSNDNILAIIIASYSNTMVYLILRALSTFDQLYSIHLDIKHPSNQLPIRCCSFKNNEWFVIDANTSQIFHIGIDGQVKGTLKYHRPPYNIILFGSNILVIRTEDGINFHELLY